MRYVRVLAAGAPRWGAIEGEAIALLDGDPIAGTARPSGEVVALGGATLLAPCAPTKIVGIGSNYRAHAAEMGKTVPDEPLLFLKPPSAVIGPGWSIVRPRGYARVDFEGELAAVIGRRARRVREEEALDHLFGLTILNDVTVRDLQKKDGQFTRAKGFDSFAPVGPCVATGIADPQALRITSRVNGVVKQDSSTGDMAFSVARLISFASHVMTLEPGDIITTGTPSGHGPLQAGDLVAITIEGIGTLENQVVEEDLP